MTLQQAENTSPPPSPVLSSGPEASVPTRSNSLGSSRPVSTSAARGPASAIAEAKEEEEHKRNVVTLQVAGENPLFVPQDDSSVKPRVSKLVDAAAVKPDAQHTGTNKEFAAVSKPSPTKPRNRKLAPTPVAASSDTRSSTVGRRRSSATSTPSQKRKRGPDADDEYLPDFDDPRTVAYLRRVDTETRDRVTRHIKTSDREFSKVVKKRTRREEEYHDKVDLVETRMDALRDTVLENEKQVEACDMKVRELEEDVEGTNTAMESMEEELDAMRSWVKEVEEKCEKRVAAMEREHRGTKKALADAKEQEKRVADLEKENAAQRTEINEMRKTMEKTLPLMKWFECFPGHGSSV
jgi:peptidoglycan hydrolase CwlO-like protein